MVICLVLDRVMVIGFLWSEFGPAIGEGKANVCAF